MSLGLDRTSSYPDDPGNERDRLDIIFQYMFDKPQWHELSHLFRMGLQWEKISEEDKRKLQNVIINSRLVETKTEPQYTMILLRERGRSILYEHKLYSKYLESLNEEIEEQARYQQTSRQKLWYETENAKNIFEDYPNIKRKSDLTILAAIISMIIAAIALIKSCSNK